MKSTTTKQIFFCVIGILAFPFCQAQVSVNSSGVDALSSGGSVAYSVGQVVFNTQTDLIASITQGVQQVYDISIVGLDEPQLEIALTVFPNPTLGKLMIEFSHYKMEKMVYHLKDIHGATIKSQNIYDQHTEIDITDLPAATYFLYVYNKLNQKYQSFKIIKSNK